MNKLKTLSLALAAGALPDRLDPRTPTRRTFLPKEDALEYSYAIWGERQGQRRVLVLNADSAELPLQFRTYEEAVQHVDTRLQEQLFLFGPEGFDALGIRAYNRAGQALWEEVHFAAEQHPTYYTLRVNEEYPITQASPVDQPRHFNNERDAVGFALAWFSEPGVEDHVWKLDLEARLDDGSVLTTTPIYWPDMNIAFGEPYDQAQGEAQ